MTTEYLFEKLKECQSFPHTLWYLCFLFGLSPFVPKTTAITKYSSSNNLSTGSAEFKYGNGKLCSTANNCPIFVTFR